MATDGYEGEELSSACCQCVSFMCSMLSLFLVKPETAGLRYLATHWQVLQHRAVEQAEKSLLRAQSVLDASSSPPVPGPKVLFVLASSVGQADSPCSDAGPVL